MNSSANALRLLSVLFVLTLSCQTKPKQEASATTVAEPADSATALATRPGPGATRTVPDRLVRALYFEHNKTENPLRETKDRALIDEFFTKPTADLIWQNAQKKSPVLVRRIKKNTLFNALDADIKKMWVEPAAVGGTRAIVYVTFENKGKPEEVKIDLRQVSGRWGIQDMRYPDGKQLTEILK